MVNGYYYAEQVIFIITSVTFTTLFILLQIAQGRLLEEWNEKSPGDKGNRTTMVSSSGIVNSGAPTQAARAKSPVTSMHIHSHPVGITVGIIGLIWSVDPQGVYGIYSYQFLVIIKITIVLLMMFIALIWLRMLINAIYASSDIELPKHSHIKFVIVPMVFFVISSYTVIGFSLAKNEEMYAGGFYIICSTFAVIVGLLSLRAHHKVFQVYRKQSVHMTPEQIKDRSSKHWKLRAIIVVAIVVAVTNILFANDAFSQGRTVQEVQIPDANLAKPYWTGLIFLLFLISATNATWLPLDSVIKSCKGNSLEDKKQPLNLIPEGGPAPTPEPPSAAAV